MHIGHDKHTGKSSRINTKRQSGKVNKMTLMLSECYKIDKLIY